MTGTASSQGSPDSSEAVRVLFVDADEGTARNAKPVFEEAFAIEVRIVSRPGDIDRALESVDCVVSELRSSEPNDLTVLQTVRRSDPDCPFVVFSERREADLVAAALAAGATDYLRADADEAGYWLLASRVASVVADHHASSLEVSVRPQIDILDGTCLLDESSTFVAVTASYAAVHGYAISELVGKPWATVVSDTGTAVLDELLDSARTEGSAVEPVVLRRRDGSTFTALLSLARFRDEQYVCTVFDGISRTETAGREHDADSDEYGRSALEGTLSRLETLSTGWLEAETESVSDCCGTVVDTIDAGTRVTFAAVYLYDESIDRLRQRAVSAGAETAASTMPFDDNSTPVWHAFVERSPVLVTELQPRPDGSVDDPALARGIVVPVGTRGVLVAGTPDGPQPTALDYAVVRLVGATAGTVLDRIDRRAQETTCERRLERATAEAGRLGETIDLIRRIARLIGRIRTRSELELRVCEQLVATDRYAFVRIAAVDDVDGSIRERAQAGSERGYLERLDSESEPLADQSEPMASAIRTLESHRRDNLLTGSADERWRQDAVSRGYRSVVAVPLTVGNRSYGGLAVYSDRSSAVDDLEYAVLEDLGVWLAHAIHAIETRTALVGRERVELEFRIDDEAIQFLEWARETGCTFEFEAVVSRPDGSIRGFFTIDGAPVERILELASQSPSVTETRLVTERGDKHLFECTLTEDSVVARLLEYGVVPKTISTTEAAGRLVVMLPEQASVRAFVDYFMGLYPESTLVRRQNCEFVAQPDYGFRSELESALTAKQLEALETAYVSGYFDVPRETTGDAIADVLGISQPTFNNHLRVAQRTLVSMVFDELAREE